MGQITRTNFGICKTVTFTNAEILQLPVNSPVELIPAIPGKVIVPLSGIAVFHWVADVTGIDDTTDLIQVGYSSAFGLIDQVCTNAILTAGSSQVAGKTWSVLVSTTDDIADYAGRIELVIVNALAFTGGAIGNRLTVKVFYNTCDV